MELKTMYPGVTNSPETFLRTSLTADGTTMYVADGSVLGTLPTLAVIGDTASAETVLVTSQAEDGGYNIQRAVEGVAIAWPQATLVARNFTNADYEALVENINDLNNGKLEQSALTDLQEEIDNLSTSKADNDDLTALQTSVSDLTDSVAIKADASTVTALEEDLETLQTSQASKDSQQDAAIAACALKTEIPEIVNDLTTGGTAAALSAEQGKTLNAAVEAVSETVETMQTQQAAKDSAQDASIAACALKTEIPTVVNDLSTGGETAALSAEQGKVLNTAIKDHAEDFDTWKTPWTAERAAKLDNLDALDADGVLSNIDATVSSRASQTSINALQGDVTTLLQQTSSGGSSVIKSVQRGYINEYIQSMRPTSIPISQVDTSKSILILNENGNRYSEEDISIPVLVYTLTETAIRVASMSEKSTTSILSWQVIEFK